MNERQAEDLLREYPARWAALCEMREQIISSGGNGEAFHGGAPTSGHSDPTFSRAVRLLALSEEESLLKAVRAWLSVRMNPEDRAFLIGLWRGRTLADFDRHAGRIGSASMRLQEMTKSLIQYVGAVCGGNGPACANIHARSRPD